MHSPPGRASGFTLVEMVMAIVIFSVMALTLTIFFKPAIQAYLGARVRGDLGAQADTALRRMQRDIQLAVPNSIRTPATDCFELVPSSTGGRFRKGPDTVNDSAANCSPSASCAAPLWLTQAVTAFDVLTPITQLPAAGDWVVIDSQNPGDLYSGANRAAITSVTLPTASFGRHRLDVVSTQFPMGYDGGRFVVVPNAQQAVFYVCSGADGSLDSSGNGKGTLHRLMNYGFNASAPVSCPATAGAAVLATRVRSCRFLFQANQGATQQSGFVSIQLELARDGEVASLVLGAHVANVP